MRRVSVILSLLLISLFFGCQREVSYIGGPDTPAFVGETATPDPLTAALQGNVFDETGTPAAGVTVQAGSKTATTNAAGYFRINDAALDKKSSVVTATKTGYFKAYRTFAATAGANNVEIKLVKRVLAGSIDAAAGGDVSLSNGSKITLPSGGVMNAATGAAYTGGVSVYAAAIDPTSADINQIIPGSFMANDKDGRRVLLSSYGMLAVELESTSGEKLQIKPGSTARLTTAIPSSAQASAPATIALWYVDEAAGIWKEEGTATKNGNTYTGDVAHFTYWNCDLAVPTVTFTARFVTANGQPLVHTPVNIRPAGVTYGGYAHGYTDSLGQVSGPVPANMNLVLEVMQYGVGQCSSPIYSQNIGPFTQAANLGTVTVPNTSNAIKTIKGKLLDCSNAPVTAGYAVISVGYYTYYASVNAAGDFEKTFVQCSSANNAYAVVGINTATQQQNAAPVTGTLTQAITDVGNVTACGTSSAQFITYVVDGTTFNLVSPGDSLTGTTTQVQGNPLLYTDIDGYRPVNNSKTQIGFSFSSSGQSNGTYAVTYLSVNSFDSTVTVTAPFNATVTNFPTATGGFYEGSFSGQFTASGAAHSISATFRVRRNR